MARRAQQRNQTRSPQRQRRVQRRQKMSLKAQRHQATTGPHMGVMAGVLLGGFLGANIFAAYYNVLDLPLAVYILLNVALFLVLLIGLGRLGWWLGRRYYRHYPQVAGPTWGESDEESDEDQAPEATSSAEIDLSDSAPEIAAHEAPATAAEPEATRLPPV
jgi:predicted lipid-binding transport protein (Tim44 family)